MCKISYILWFCHYYFNIRQPLFLCVQVKVVLLPVFSETAMAALGAWFDPERCYEVVEKCLQERAQALMNEMLQCKQQLVINRPCRPMRLSYLNALHSWTYSSLRAQTHTVGYVVRLELTL